MKTYLELAEESGLAIITFHDKGRFSFYSDGECLDRYSTLLLADRMPSRERLIELLKWSWESESTFWHIVLILKEMKGE